MLIVGVLVSVCAAISIDAFGAVTHNESVSACSQNSAAIYRAFQAANASSTDRTVQIPGGHNYFILSVPLMVGVRNVTLQLDGNITCSTNITAWGRFKDNALGFSNCANVRITGNGVFDGQGYEWWNRAIENRLVDGRPTLIGMDGCTDVLIENSLYLNSPQYHLNLHDMRRVVIRNLRIWVNVTAQKTLLESHGLMSARSDAWPSLPTFPLNTDGIDAAGIDFHMYNMTIENYDDAVAVKPMHTDSRNLYANCSSGMLVENSYVVDGVGMTIGSVPPHVGVNCVRNITFRNVDFKHPFKAIYVKTNPGEDGTGLITDILYEDISISDAIWWTIYIGPQQQKQPDGGGPGCMLYPLDPDCATNPRVPISNITLRNVTAKDSILNAGILRCNATNPCTGFVFDNVHVQGGDWPRVGYISEYVHGVALNSEPVPAGFSTR